MLDFTANAEALPFRINFRETVTPDQWVPAEKTEGYGTDKAKKVAYTTSDGRTWFELKAEFELVTMKDDNEDGVIKDVRFYVAAQPSQVFHRNQSMDFDGLVVVNQYVQGRGVVTRFHVDALKALPGNK